MLRVRRAIRASLPIRYAFSFVSEAPESSAKASRPYFSWMPWIFAATRSRASGHSASRKPLLVVVLQVALHALGAEHPAVHGELLPGLEAHHLVVANLQLDAALHAAEAAVRLDARLLAVTTQPAARGRVVGVRAVERDQL